MKKRMKILAWILASMLCLTSCGALPDTDSVLQGGGAEFAEGKTENDHAIMSSDEILDKMIAEFSGSHETPTGNSVSQDQADQIKDQIADEQIVIGGGLDGCVQIASRDELKNVMHQMFDETKELVELEFTGSYVADINEILDIHDDLIGDDAFDIICLKSVSWSTSGNYMTLNFIYNTDVETLKQMKQETRTLLQEAKSKINVSGLSDYQIVCAVNDYLCDIVVYPDKEPYANESHTAWSAFKYGSAVCDGYSRAAKLLLNEFGIECDIVIGDAGGGHAWNLVKLDGNWYQMDVTWNDCSAQWDPNGRTTYLLVTDDFMKQSRVWDYADYPATPSKPYK